MKHDIIRLRDQFATSAITGAALEEGSAIAADTEHAERLARRAYAIADAMIRARIAYPADFDEIEHLPTGLPA